MWIAGDLAILIPAYLLLVLVRHEAQELKRVDARLARAKRLALRKES